MALRINTNIAAFNAHRTLAGTERGLARSLERLSSGLRINRAADDAAGLAISESLTSQFRGHRQAARNILDAISALQAADGALSEVTAIVQRMRELAVQSANAVYTGADRDAINAEALALKQEIRNIAANTTFNEFPLLAGAGDDWVTSGVRNATSTLSPLTNNFTVTERESLQAVTPRTATTQSFAVDQRQNLFAVDATTTAVTLTAAAEQYGLGAAGPQSIVVTMRDTGTGTTRAIAYDATNGFTYDAATRQVRLHGTAAAGLGEDQLQVDFIPLGGTAFNLSTTPLPGTLTVDNGGPLVQSAANGYTLTGTTVRLTGNARPTAGVPMTVQANYERATTTVTLAPGAENYGLGGGPPTSMVVRLRNTGTGVTRVVPYDPANGFSYNSATRRITFNGSFIPTGGENQVEVDYIPLGGANFTLASPPVAGSETIRVNGAPLAEDPANGYTLAGSTVRLNGTSRPSVGVPMTVSADYLPAGSTTVALDSTNPFFGGVTLNRGSLVVSVDGVPQAFVEDVDYTISETVTDRAGLTPLYSYSLTINNATLAAAASDANPTLSVDFTVDYPTTYGPFGVEIQSGANFGETHTIGFDRIHLDALGIATTDLSTQAGAGLGISELDGALVQLAEIRGRYGADTNRLEHALDNITSQALQSEAAYSRIRDADMAAEMSALTRRQILMQSGTSMLQQAQVAPQQVLSLLSS